MGFGKLVKRVAAGVATGGISEALRLGNKAMGGGSNGGGPAYQDQQIDPQVKALQEAQQKRATDFRANLPNEQNKQYGMAEESSRKNLASDMSANTQGFNSRGLLYSGLKQGADVDAQTESASNLASKKADINSSLENQAQGLESTALTGNMNVAALENQNQNARQQFNFQKQQQRNGLLGSILGAGGSVAGGYFGGKR